MKRVFLAGFFMLCAWGAGAESVGAGSGVSVVTGNESYAVRQAAVKRLGERLSENEIHSLILLLQRKPGEDVLRIEEFNALKNEVVNVLKRQPRFADELAEHLMQMHVSVGVDVVWEDYCIQHLGGLFRKIEPTLRQQAADLFFEATDVKGGSLCGTALIALKTNVASPEVDKEQVRAVALQVATSRDWDAPARITAIQICSQFEDEAVLPTARQIMGDDAQDILLRMSAIAAVGAGGDLSDAGELSRLCGNRDFRIKRAATAAVKRLRERGEDEIRSHKTSNNK